MDGEGFANPANPAEFCGLPLITQVTFAVPQKCNNIGAIAHVAGVPSTIPFGNLTHDHLVAHEN